MIGEFLSGMQGESVLACSAQDDSAWLSMTMSVLVVKLHHHARTEIAAGGRLLKWALPPTINRGVTHVAKAGCQ